MYIAQINDIHVFGHNYNVKLDHNGKVIATECIGRWLMSEASTGDPWLDGELQKQADTFRLLCGLEVQLGKD